MSEESADRVRQLHEQVNSIERDAALNREAAAAAIEETIDQVAATAEQAAQSVNTKYETAADGIRAHPFVAILGAAAVGFVLGRALR